MGRSTGALSARRGVFPLLLKPGVGEGLALAYPERFWGAARMGRRLAGADSPMRLQRKALATSAAAMAYTVANRRWLDTT